MAPQDLKRLIAGFLVFSAITSALTLISLNFIGTTPATKETFRAEGENPLATVGKNAFAENLPAQAGLPSGEKPAGNAYQQKTAANGDSSNLTQNFAAVFASQMMAKNPDGPQLDQNGGPTVLNLPGENVATEMIKQALSKSSLAFDEKVSVPTSRVMASFSRDDVSNYLNQVYKILDQVSSSTKSSLAGVQNPTADDLSLQALAIEAAFNKLSSLSVPKPFVELHTTLLRLFANQKNIFYAVTDYRNDPIKTILVVQNEDEIVARDLARVKKAALKVPKEISFNSAPEWERLYSGIFGIQKAYAQLATFDSFNFANTLATVSNLISNNLGRIADWAYTTALRVAVNVLINEFQNQVVNWIAGGGKPKFITDWNGFFKDVANKAAGQIIYGIAPQFCSGIGPLLRVSLLPVPRADTGVNCTFNQVVSNVNNFFNRFKNGGWYYYSQLTQPRGNYYGQLIEFNDNIIRTTAEAQNTASAQAQANKGFLSVTKCTKYAVDENNNPTTTCEPGYEVITTPGSAVGEALTQSFGWKPNQIVSAQRFEDLVAAIVNASINRVIKEGLSSLTEATNPSRPSFTNATPAGITNPANLTTTKTNVNNLFNSYGQIGLWQANQDIINADTQWLALATQTSTVSAVTGASTIDLLRQLVNSCPVITDSPASERIADINSMAADTRAELNNAININSLRGSALAATSTQDIADIINRLQEIDINQVKGAAAGARARLSSLQYFNSVVQSSLANGDCSTLLPAATSTPPAPSVD